MSSALSQPKRFIVFALNVAAFYMLYVWASGHWSLTGGLDSLWLGSAVAWWALSLLSAPFFRPPKDALAAGVAAFLALAAIQLDSRIATYTYVNGIRNLGIAYALFVAISALVAATVERKQYERFARFSYLVAERLSSGPFLFGVVAFVSIFGAYSDFGTILILSLSWLFFALVRPFETMFSLADQWAAHSSDTAGKAIGQIIGVQSRHTYLAKLLAERVKIKRYDFVEFLDGADSDVSRKGFVVDNWVLNAEQWVKIVSGPDINKSLGRDRITPGMQPHIVYKITTEDTANILGRFVGTVAEGSNILAINFDYGMKVAVSEGTLPEVPIGDQRVLYQITQGSTQTEILENKNEAGLIIGQAAQIGTWNPEAITLRRRARLRRDPHQQAA